VNGSLADGSLVPRAAPAFAARARSGHVGSLGAAGSRTAGEEAARPLADDRSGGTIHNHAVVHDGDAIGDLAAEAHLVVVRRHRHALCARPHDGDDVGDDLQIQRRRRLVESISSRLAARAPAIATWKRQCADHSDCAASAPRTRYGVPPPGLASATTRNEQSGRLSCGRLLVVGGRRVRRASGNARSSVKQRASRRPASGGIAPASAYEWPPAPPDAPLAAN
jgi:hypothetical protein